MHFRLSQSSPGCDHCLVSHWLSVDLVQFDHIFGIESRNPPGIGFEVVNQKCFLDLELVGQALWIQ